MAPTLDLAGQRFGRLTVVSFAFSRNATFWNCLCDCGKSSVVRAALLRNGTTKSCGCGSKEQARINCRKWWRRNERIPIEIRARLKHAYTNMIKRCSDPRNHRYANYGRRGIAVCQEWTGSEGRHRFYDWAMAQGYSEGLSLDRINVNGDYTPDNCRLVGSIIQANNTTRNHYITWQNETLSAADWARRFGLTYSSMIHRVRRGWAMDRIAKQPMRKRRRG